jgi:hypothetical protein
LFAEYHPLSFLIYRYQVFPTELHKPYFPYWCKYSYPSVGKLSVLKWVFYEIWSKHVW